MWFKPFSGEQWEDAVSNISTLVYSSDTSFHVLPKETETEERLVILILPKPETDLWLIPTMAAIVDKRVEKLVIEEVAFDDPIRFLWDPRANGNLTCLRAELFDSPPAPKDWYLYHLQECGTKYRGCAPFCPKDRYERTGYWDTGLAKSCNVSSEANA
jgi:hypothetical protein